MMDIPGWRYVPARHCHPDVAFLPRALCYGGDGPACAKAITLNEGYYTSACGQYARCFECAVGAPYQMEMTI